MNAIYVNDLYCKTENKAILHYNNHVPQAYLSCVQIRKHYCSGKANVNNDVVRLNKEGCVLVVLLGTVKQ